MARTVRPSPVTPEGDARQVMDDRRQIETLQTWHKSIPAVVPGDKLESPKTDRQGYKLGEGDYKPTAAKSTVRVDTIGSGSNTTISPNLTISTPYAYYQNVRFLGTITVPAGSVLVLTGCQVTQVISVAAGANVHASGCLFSNTGHIDNSGGPTDSCVTMSHRTSTTPHINILILDET